MARSRRAVGYFLNRGAVVGAGGGLAWPLFRIGGLALVGGYGWWLLSIQGGWFR